jgi:hypothetical protein
MKKILSILAVIVLTSIAANAGQAASASSKQLFAGKQISPASGIITASAMPCGMCKAVTLTVQDQVATKASRGTVAETVTVDRCPRCAEKLVTTSLKQTEQIHTCGGVQSSCCKVS